MSTVFISYRREDSQSAAGRLADHFEAHLKGISVFRDVQAIAPGEDFVEAIEKAVSASDIMLVVIGSRWLTITNAKGMRRLDDASDYHRQEMSQALRLNKLVIPILVDGAKMPEVQDLPEELQQLNLTRRNAYELSDKRWDFDVAELAKAIRKSFSLPELPPNKHKSWFRLAFGIPAIVALMAGIWMIMVDSIIQVDKENFLRNGEFEEGLKYWGTGYYETDEYRGSLGAFWASRVGNPTEVMKVADVRGDIDSDIYRSGSKSFKITNNSPLEPHIYGSMSQRITGLLKNTDYIASFWIKVERANSGTFVLTTDLKWHQKKKIEPGTYNWKQFSHVFNTGNDTFVDFRIISEEPGTVWIDDMTFKRYFPHPKNN